MPEMKDSGIEWIGEIPKDWKCERFKYICSSTNVGESIDKNYWSSDHLDNVFYTAGEKNIYTTYPNFPDWKYTRSNDLLLARNGTPYVYNCPQHAMYSDHIIRVTIKEAYNKTFVAYAIQQSIYHFLVDSVSIPTWSVSIWKEQTLAIPPVSMQNRITSFLYFKCSEIDALCADIEEQIRLLEEYKKSVITEAVTKGLDSNVEMKDSGVEWIGMIPKHWDVHPIYRYYGERKVKNSALKEQNLLSLSYGKIIRKDIGSLGGLLPASFSTYNIVEPNDIIIRPTDLQNDKRSLRTGLVTEHGIITSAYIDLMPKASVNSKYFHYLLHTYDVMKVFYNMGNGVRQGLNYSEFAKLMVFSPPINEQNGIAIYLDKKCSEIDSLVSKKEQQLSLLEDHKKSLIYEYITGKKEVPADFIGGEL